MSTHYSLVYVDIAVPNVTLNAEDKQLMAYSYSSLRTVQYSMSQKSWPFCYSEYTMTIGQKFYDIQSSERKKILVT